MPSFDQIIIWIMAIGAVIGALDKIIGNRFGLGEQFDEGFNAMGPLALGMVGMVSLSPVIAKVLGPALVPAFNAIGSDPALFGAILPNDTGGYPLAMELAQNYQAGQYAGLIVASMLGCTITFSIPVGLGLIEKEDRPYFARGLLIGFLPIPVASILGGLMAGFNAGMVFMNTIPVIIITVLIAIGLYFIPDGMAKGCLVFGRIITIIITIGLVCSAFEALTGVVIIPGMAPISEGLSIIGSIGVVLLGTFPILTLLMRLLNKPLTALGKKIGLDSTSAAGLVFTLANSIPVYKMMKDMNKKGIIVNTAWLVLATAALGDHLGFTAGVAPEFITPVVISKIIGGILAVLLALAMTKNMAPEPEKVPVAEEASPAAE
ncbi:MAG: ethanolamine utilization protein EutH [Clostridiaceae bacterium]|nr:ethanolamine utilization protein EutH [Clostridiaceae bacterium]